MPVSTFDIVRRHAARAPGAIAIIEQSGRRRTYGDLHARATSLASALQTLGVLTGDRVSVLAPNRVECVEIFFACAAIGAVHAPLNFRASPATLSALLTDAGSRVLFVHSDMASVVPQLRGAVVDVVVGFGAEHGLGHDYEALLEASRDRPLSPVEIAEDAPCWIAYTGGTTGKSKGVLLRHRNLFTNIVNLIVADRIVVDDVYMITGSLFHILIRVRILSVDSKYE